MQNFRLKIEKQTSKDLTIIYKEGSGQLHEIKASKLDFLNTLKAFQNKSNEINLTSLIYIQEDISFDIFEKFILSINTKEIDINENNYKSFLYLSCKYEYEELRYSITNFIEKRPDICLTINNLVESAKNQKEAEFSFTEDDFIKEELLSRNLDVCLQNNFFINFPLEKLNRILNSPKRVINDHHLLFSFVIGMIQKKLEDDNQDDLDKISVLPSCLDYCQMENNEIEKLFSLQKELNAHFLSPRKSEEKIAKLISTENEMKAKIDELEAKLNGIETKLIKKIDDNFKVVNDEINSQFAVNEKNQQKFDESIQESFTSKCDEQNLKIINIEKEIKKIKEILEKHINEIKCNSGIFHYLFYKYHVNPTQNGLVEITGNSQSGQNENLLKIIDASYISAMSQWVSNSEANSYIKISFKKFCVQIEKYKLLVAFYDGSGYFNSWILKGTTANNEEIVLDDVETSEITRSNSEITRNVPISQFLCSIQLIMKGYNSCGDYRMALRNIELFGTLRESINE